MAHKLIIRYADHETTPSRYPSQGWTRTDPIITDGCWTLRGSLDALSRHIDAALADDNLDSYRITKG